MYNVYHYAKNHVFMPTLIISKSGLQQNVRKKKWKKRDKLPIYVLILISIKEGSCVSVCLSVCPLFTTRPMDQPRPNLAHMDTLWHPRCAIGRSPIMKHVDKTNFDPLRVPPGTANHCIEGLSWNLDRGVSSYLQWYGLCRFGLCGWGRRSGADVKKIRTCTTRQNRVLQLVPIKIRACEEMFVLFFY